MMNNEDQNEKVEEDWTEFHNFATSIGGSKKCKKGADSPTSTPERKNPEADRAAQEFSCKHKTERYRGRGHMLQEMAFKNVKLMDYRTSKELRSSGISMRDPDMDTIRNAALFAKLNFSLDSSLENLLEAMEPRFPKPRTPPESSGQFEDARTDEEPTNSSLPEGLTLSEPKYFSVPDPVARSKFEGTYPESAPRPLHPSAIDAFNYKFDESGFSKVDPSSLEKDSHTPSPCSSPLPDDIFLQEEINESKTDSKVQNVVRLNTSTPIDHQVAPDKSNKDLEEFILSFENKLSEHPEVLKCFLDVVTAWTNEEITFLEMEETLTEILSGFPDLLKRLIAVTKAMEFPHASANIPIKRRQKYRNLVVANFWKKEEERWKKGKVDKNRFMSIIKDCLSQIKDLRVSEEMARPAESHVQSAAIDEINFPPLIFRSNLIPCIGNRGEILPVDDLD